MGSCEKCNSGPGMCIDCQAALQGRVKYLEAVQLAHREDAERHREENARLRKVVDAARKYVTASELPSHCVTLTQTMEYRTALRESLRELDGEKKCGLCTDIKPCNFEACPDGQ